MCGMCGFAYADGRRPAEAELLRRMRAMIDHRGPDGAGEHCSGPVGLGHTRLSIIDVAGGAQPITNEDGSVWVSFNGEIYNYQALTGALRDRGHRFRTRSDTEVLVHLYEEHGPEFPRQLNGMFAFALHDTKRQRLVLARDQLGIKPLFYACTPDGLFFGSEVKAVLAGAGIAARARPEAVAEYLTFRYVAGSRTFFDGVHRLPPGHIAIWENGRLDVRPYWRLPDADPNAEGQSLDEAADSLGALLRRSVDAQMMSEVPIGAFCSGGIDSGLVTAFASELSPHRLETFSVGFEDPSWDETALARDTAARFGTAHHVVVAKPARFEALLERLVWYHDEPLSHPNAVPLYLLSRLARQRVTVALTGEGADELFGGYPRYHIARLRAVLEPLPEWARGSLGWLAGRMPGHRAARVAELIPEPATEALLLNSAYVHPRLVESLLGIPVRDALDERRALLRASEVPGDPVATISRYELRTYLGCALDRMDRMSMATGLEGRVPFLDLPLVEWGARLDSSLKIAGRENKRVVRRLAERMLSTRITSGGKSGFGLPLDAWFRSPALAGLVARLRDTAHPAAEHFDRVTLQRIVDQHMSGRADHGEALWLLSNVYLWYDVQRDPRTIPGDLPAGEEPRAVAA